jgi:homoserine dehydrogenase
MLVPNESQLANIDYEFNGIMVRGDCTGDVVFYGKGAGKLPTASAVVADVVDCCKHLKTRKYLYWTDGDGKNILPTEQSVSSMYVRASGSDVISKAEKLFSSVSKIERADADETAFVTSEIPYGEFNEKIAALENDGVTVLSTIRIGDL